MKILKVQFQNLNSLKGQWEIDFEAYNNDGIFAIFGPTGSGKTTILDALTLALYGQTSRLGSISKSSNEILNKDSASCFANVYFKVGNNKYLASWRQQRAHNKVDGALQDPQRKFYLVQDIDGEEVTTILAEKVQTVKNEIEKIVKLNFEQFTRIVLLPQGAFANFLKASGDARAAILEKITDTYKYSKISEKVYALTTEKEKVINDAQLVMQSIVCKSNEEVNALTENALQLAKEIENYKNLADKLQKDINVAENLAALVLEKDQLSLQFAKQQETEELFKEKANILIVANKAEQLALDFHKLETSQQALNEILDSLLKVKEKITLSSNELTKLEALKNTLKENLNIAEANYNKELPIINLVRKIDNEIVYLTTNKNNIQKEVDDNKVILTKVKKDVIEYQNNLASKESQLIKVSQFVDNHPEGEIILTQLSGWEHQFNDISLKERNQIVEYNTWQKNEKDLELWNQEITHIQGQIEKQQIILQDFIANYNKAQATLTSLLGGSKKEDLEDKLSLLKELKEKSLVIASLEEHRSKLKDNERCPLCGSLEHPYSIKVDNNLDETTQQILNVEKQLKNIDQIEKNIVKLSKNVEVEQSKLNNLTLLLEEKLKVKDSLVTNVSNSKKLYEEKTLEIANAKSSLITVLSPLGVKQYPSNFTVLLNDFKKIAKEYQISKANISSLSEECAGLKATLASFNDIIVEKEKHQSQLNINLTEAEKILFTKSEERFKQYGKKNPDVEELQLKDLFNLASAKLNNFEEKFNLAKNNHSTLLGQLSNLEILQKQHQEEFNFNQNNFTYKLKENDFASLEDYKKSCLSKEKIAELKFEQENIKNNAIKLTTQKLTNETKIKELEEKNTSNKTLIELKELLADCKNNLQQVTENRSAILNALESDKESFERKQAQAKEIASLVKSIEPWRKLKELIGSADGKKFRTYVQALTLQNILRYANIQLKNITSNYTLIGHAENHELSMDIDVVDANNNCTRPTSNLSGGETFVVSLALALGLASMASNNIKVESLFLDEGFGTLDATSLDIVLDTLANLKEEGKTIGIISHVEALKERIDKKITLKTSCGISTIEGDGIISLDDKVKSSKEIISNKKK